jgi:hypothetical protein
MSDTIPPTLPQGAGYGVVVGIGVSLTHLDARYLLRIASNFRSSFSHFLWQEYHLFR